MSTPGGSSDGPCGSHRAQHLSGPTGRAVLRPGSQPASWSTGCVGVPATLAVSSAATPSSRVLPLWYRQHRQRCPDSVRDSYRRCRDVVQVTLHRPHASGPIGRARPLDTPHIHSFLNVQDPMVSRLDTRYGCQKTGLTSRWMVAAFQTGRVGLGLPTTASEARHSSTSSH